jgi:hypothetical protein
MISGVSLKLKLTTLIRQIHSESFPVEENTISLNTGKLSSAFRFKPEARWSRKTAILKVVVHGYTLKEFHEYEWSLKELQKREASNIIREEQFEALKTEEDGIRQRIKSLSGDVGKLTAQQSEFTKSSASLHDQIYT